MYKKLIFIFLSEDTKLKVKQFFEFDDVSPTMPGRKDVKAVKIDGKKCNIQNRLVMGNMKDIFKKFKKENPNIEIGFSKFCSLRPEHCVLSGSG